MLPKKHGWVIGVRATIRYLTTKSAPKPELKYTSTVNLPKTKFPARLSAEKRAQVEEQLRKVRSFATKCAVWRTGQHRVTKYADSASILTGFPSFRAA